MNKLVELLKLDRIEREFFEITRGWIFEGVELKDTYDFIQNSISSDIIPIWEKEGEMIHQANDLKELLTTLNLETLKEECQLLTDIWNYADSKGYDDICEMIDYNQLEALENINLIISECEVENYTELVEAWG